MKLEPPSLSNSFEFNNSVLSFSKAEELTVEHGSPLMVYSRENLRKVFRVMQESMPKMKIHYAMKANHEDELLRTLASEGSCIDVCTDWELFKALANGFSIDKVIHTHPCKSETNLDKCYKLGARWFVFDCKEELFKMSKKPYFKDLNLILRISAENEYSLINLSKKFGCPVEDSFSLANLCCNIGGNLKGISFHVGSQCENPEAFRTAIINSRKLWDFCVSIGASMQMIDIGGGFPAPRIAEIISLSSYCKKVYSILEESFQDTNAEYVCEPGRALCSSSVTLVCSIIGKTERKGVQWYFIDDGICASFSGKVFDGMSYKFLHKNSFSDSLKESVISGPSCDSGDILDFNALVPSMNLSDLILIPGIGAYSSVTSSPRFNGISPAKAIFID